MLCSWALPTHGHFALPCQRLRVVVETGVVETVAGLCFFGSAEKSSCRFTPAEKWRVCAAATQLLGAMAASEAPASNAAVVDGGGLAAMHHMLVRPS